MSSFFARTQAACTLITLLCCAGACATESSTASTLTLTLAQAIERAKIRNPALAASMYELKVIEARKVQASVRPNPELSLDLEDFAGSGATQGTNALQATLALSQAIELGDKRSLRMQAAVLQGELTAIEQQGRELDLFAEVTKRFIDVVAAQEHLALTRSGAGLADATVTALTTRVQVARSPQAELSRAQIAATRARIDVLQAESKLQSARGVLAALWGELDTDFREVRADLYSLAAIVPLAELRERIERSPSITRFATESRHREAQWQLTRAQARPNLTVSLGIRRLQTTGDNALVAGVSLPLPLSDRGRGAIAEAQVRREQTTAEKKAARIRLQGLVAEFYEQISFSREQLNLLRNDAIPQAQMALEQTQYGYERGRFSYVELASAQQELIVLRTVAIEAAADFHRLSAEIERLTGTALASQMR